MAQIRTIFFLTTLLDDFAAGFPVGFCISNTPPSRQMEIFFRATLGKFRIFTPEVLMSFDSTAFFNSWRNIMGESPQKIMLLKIENLQL